MNIPEFKNQKLAEQVFVHKSYLNEGGRKLSSNERLEFLGDSILSFVVSSYLFRTYPEYNEGQLTNLRSVLTNTQTLAFVAEELGLGKKLKLSKGEDSGQGRKNKTILANTLEAVIGGIFIDGGLKETEKFIETIILSKKDELVKHQGLKDPKSELQERLQEVYKISPEYKIISEKGPDHEREYTVGVYIENRLLAEGVGKSKQEAEKNAAREALTVNY